MYCVYIGHIHSFILLFLYICPYIEVLYWNYITTSPIHPPIHRYTTKGIQNYNTNPNTFATHIRTIYIKSSNTLQYIFGDIYTRFYTGVSKVCPKIFENNHIHWLIQLPEYRNLKTKPEEVNCTSHLEEAYNTLTI